MAVHADNVAHLRSNSNAVGEAEVDLPPRAKREQVYIGKSTYADCSYFSGAIGEVLIYSRALNDSELRHRSVLTEEVGLL